MEKKIETQSEAFNIKDFITKALAFKYFYIICMIICLAGAYLTNKYSSVIYEVHATMGPVDDKRSSLLGSNDLFAGLGALAESRNLENDINSLQSFTLVANTLNKMHLEIGYYTEMNSIFKQQKQAYRNSPYFVNIDRSHVQPINSRFYIQIIDNNTFRLSCSEEEVALYNYLDNQIISRGHVFNLDTICRFNETIIHPYFKFSVSLNQNFKPGSQDEDELSYFILFHLDQLTLNYLRRLKVEPVSFKSSLIKVYFQGANLNQTVDFLNNYLQTYLEDNLSKKNKIAVNTINFIDSQISEISDSLMMSESKLKDYRAAHQVTDLSYQGQRALQMMTQIETDRTNLQMQERYYNYILDYFNQNKDMAGLAPPSAANVSDPIMNNLIMELLASNAERSTILSNSNEKNLFLGQIENKIRLQKQAIIENVTNNLNTLTLTMNELNYRSEKLSREISNLPRTEINMVSIQRKFNLSDAIYTFLLQKRSEAAITMASNYPNYEIMDPAREISRTMLSPKTKLNWLIALFLGMMIPTVFVILRTFFNDKISSVFDVEYLLKRPILGVIYTNPYKTEAVVAESPGSSISESFRNLRTSLLLKFKSDPLKLIIVTSPQPQDGKSFIAFNLASSIASVGYRTILIDGDFRRPTIHSKFKQENNMGLSTYMTDHTSEEEIVRTSFVKNLSFIPAGPLLPNSAELIESGVLDNLINYLKDKYDYIIIDTTPTGLVADAVLMMKYASINLLICRNNFTHKEVLSDVITLFNTNQITNYDVVFNDMDLKKSRYGHYSNYFKKGK